MKPESSEARNTTQRAISSGSPKRPAGICAMIAIAHLFRNGHDHICADVAGADCIGGDACARAFLGQGFDDAEVAGFGRGIVDLGELAFLTID